MIIIISSERILPNALRAALQAVSNDDGSLSLPSRLGLGSDHNQLYWPKSPTCPQPAAAVCAPLRQPQRHAQRRLLRQPAASMFMGQPARRKNGHRDAHHRWEGMVSPPTVPRFAC